MAKPVVCFNCEVGGVTRRLRRLLKVIPGRRKGRHCENCGQHLAEPVEAWIRERDAEREGSGRNPVVDPNRERPPRQQL